MPAHPTAAARLPCPNPSCVTTHIVRNGTINGRQRYHCRDCGAWFGDIADTPLYRLRTPPAEIDRPLLEVMRQGSLRAVEEQTGHKYATISHWLRLAAAHAESVSDTLARDLRLSMVEMDEFWSFVKRNCVMSRRRIRRRSVTAGPA